MQIDINRTESRNFMGSTKFRVDVKFIPTSEELAAIQKYKLGKKQLTMDTKKNLVTREALAGFTINEMIKGVHFESKRMEEIVEFEASVTEAAHYVKEYIEAGSVTGRQVIEV